MYTSIMYDVWYMVGNTQTCTNRKRAFASSGSIFNIFEQKDMALGDLAFLYNRGPSFDKST